MGRTVGIAALVALGACATAQAAGEDGLDAREYRCLASELFARGQGQEAPKLTEAAWILANRRSSPEFPSAFCDLGETEADPPWVSSDLNGIVNRIITGGRGTDIVKAAVAELDKYKANLAVYQRAQIVAYQLMMGWITEDPTNGATEFDSNS